ncbi:hypothetical protein BsWGS_11866 [Bradybaena similaris]
MCVPVNHSAGETDKDLGTRFQICIDSEFHVFECEKGLKFDVVTTDCREGLPRCENSGEMSTSTLPPSPRSTARNNKKLPPQAATTTPPARNSTSSLTSTTKITPDDSATTQPAMNLSRECTADNCKTPNCFCPGAKPEIDASLAPMMVMLTFDDAVTAAFMEDFYRGLLVDNEYSLQNPNNCSIKAAFFLSAANTDYTQVKVLYDKGHEFASHTVNHILPHDGTKEVYKDEIVGIRDQLVSQAMVDGNKVVGFRAPYLKLAGNQMFQVLHENKFLYDSSISNIESKKGLSHLFPFTLDFPIPESKCPNGPCPTESFPGLWEVPINAWITEDDGYCAMIDACIVANLTDDKATVKTKYLKYFRKNFYESFYPEKVPMHLFTHASLFLRQVGSFEALTEFLQEINSLPDVWLLTPSQVIDWMKTPVSNVDAANGILSSWKCGDAKH